MIRLLGNSSQVKRKKNPSMEVRETESSLLKRKRKGNKRVLARAEQQETISGVLEEPSGQGVQRATVKGVCDNHSTEMKNSIRTNRTQPSVCVCGHSNACLLFCYVVLALVEMLWEWFQRAK